MAWEVTTPIPAESLSPAASPLVAHLRANEARTNPSFAFQQLRISAGLPPTRMAGEGDAAKAVRPSQKGQWSKAALEVKAAAKKKH